MGTSSGCGVVLVLCNEHSREGGKGQLRCEFVGGRKTTARTGRSVGELGFGDTSYNEVGVLVSSDILCHSDYVN